MCASYWTQWSPRLPAAPPRHNPQSTRRTLFFLGDAFQRERLDAAAVETCLPAGLRARTSFTM